MPVNDTTRRILDALVGDGRVRRPYLGQLSTPAPLPAPVAEAQSLQRLLFDEAIGRPLPVTVHRRGARVDVVALPTELTGG